MTDNRPPLVLKPRRRMLQPTKDELRRQLAVANARIAALEGPPVRPWWRRLADRLSRRGKP